MSDLLSVALNAIRMVETRKGIEPVSAAYCVDQAMRREVRRIVAESLTKAGVPEDVTARIVAELPEPVSAPTHDRFSPNG